MIKKCILIVHFKRFVKPREIINGINIRKILSAFITKLYLIYIYTFPVSPDYMLRIPSNNTFFQPFQKLN